MENKVYEVLQHLGISYQVLQHPPLFKSSDEQKYGITFGDATCYKNLLLIDPKTKQCYLVCMPVHKRLDLKRLQEQLGTHRLSFASEIVLQEKLGVTTGNASLFNIILKPNTDVIFVLDEQMKEEASICFHPNVNTASVIMTKQDVDTLLQAYQVHFQWRAIPSCEVS